MSIYDYSVMDMYGNTVSLEEFKGKVLLIVNTAIQCGFTPQYSKLEEIYRKHLNDDFEILDFPCNQFLNQAPGSDEEISNFCKTNYNISFRQFSKINVNGKREDPLYKYLKSQQGGMFGGAIKWNFTKFLVNKQGDVVKRYEALHDMDDIAEEIQKLLKE